MRYMCTKRNKLRRVFSTAIDLVKAVIGYIVYKSDYLLICPIYKFKYVMDIIYSYLVFTPYILELVLWQHGALVCTVGQKSSQTCAKDILSICALGLHDEHTCMRIDTHSNPILHGQ